MICERDDFIGHNGKIDCKILFLTIQQSNEKLMIPAGNTNLAVVDCCDAWEDLKAGAEND